MTACTACGHDPAAIVTASWSLFIPLDAKGMNSRIVNSGASRWAYASERDSWSLVLRNAMRLADVPRATQFRRVTLTRCYHGRQRMLDRDNHIGGAKSLVDALVKAGVLVDDDAKHAEINYRQERAAPTGVRIVIEEIAV